MTRFGLKELYQFRHGPDNLRDAKYHRLLSSDFGGKLQDSNFDDALPFEVYGAGEMQHGQLKSGIPVQNFFDDQAKRECNSVVKSLREKENIIVNLQNLFNLLRKYNQSMRKISEHLARENIANVLTDRLCDVLQQELNENSWQVMLYVYSITCTLTAAEEDNETFVTHTLETAFVDTTIKCLENESVKAASHSAEQLYSGTLSQALDTLLYITRRSPLLDYRQYLEKAILPYCKSEITELAQSAEKLKVSLSLHEKRENLMKINVTLSGQILTSQDLNDPDLVLAVALARTLASWTKEQRFLTETLPDKEWNDINSAIIALESLSFNNSKFTHKLCEEGVITMVYDILSEHDIIRMAAVSQNVAIFVQKLLGLLIHMNQCYIPTKYQVDLQFFDVFWRIMQNSGDKAIRMRALLLSALYARIESKDVSVSCITFAASPDNVNVVIDTCGTLSINSASLFGDFLVASDFIHDAGKEMSKLIADQSTGNMQPDEKQRQLLDIMTSLHPFAKYNKRVVDAMVENKMDELIKAHIMTDMCKKHKNNETAKFHVALAIQLLLAVAHHGYCERVNGEDMLELICKWAAKDEDVVIRRWAMIFLVRVYSSVKKRHFKLPIIDRKDVEGAIDFLQDYIATFSRMPGQDDANRALADYLDGEDALKYITGDLTNMVNANLSSLKAMIQKTKRKFELLKRISECVAFDGNLSRDFLKSRFLDLLSRMLTDGDILLKVKDKDHDMASFLVDILCITMELSQARVIVEQLAKRNLLKKMLPFLNGQMVGTEEILLLCWGIFLAVWRSSGHQWPRGCGITQSIFTEATSFPGNMAIMLRVRDMRQFTEMNDCQMLASQICQDISKMLAQMESSPGEKPNLMNEMNVSSYLLCAFSSVNQEFNRHVITSADYKAWIRTSMDAKHSCKYGIQDKVHHNLIRLCVGVALHTAGSPYRDILVKPPYKELIQMAIMSKESVLQLHGISLSQSMMAHNFKQLPSMHQFDYRESLMSIIFPYFASIALYGKPYQYSGGINLTHRGFLRTLRYLAGDVRKNALILQMYSKCYNFGIGDIMDYSLRNSLQPNEDLRELLILTWCLALNKANVETLKKDKILMNTMESHSNCTDPIMLYIGYLVLLEITGCQPAPGINQQDPFDIAVIWSGDDGKSAQAATCVISSLQSEGFDVRNITFRSPPAVFINAVCNCQFVIFLFDEATTGLMGCRSAVNHAQRIGKPYIGVFLDEIDEDSWEHSISPQNKIADDQPERVAEKIVSITKRQLSRVPLQFADSPEDNEVVNKFVAFASDCKVGQLFAESSFVGSVFDSAGGYLKLPSKDVCLYIPPGAVKEGDRQPVYLHAVTSKYGEIHPDRLVLTPVVRCGPDGTTFLKDVLLTFPHSAVNEDSWEFSAVTKSPGCSWKRLDEEDSTLLVKDGFMFLFLDHFTLFAGEAKAKEDGNTERLIKVGLRGYFRNDTCCQIDIGAWYERNPTSEQMAYRWPDRQPFLVTSKDTYIRIEMKDVDSDWVLKGSNSFKSISLKNLTDETSDVLSCRYIYHHRGGGGAAEKPDDFFGIASLSLDVSDNWLKMDLYVQRTDVGASAAHAPAATPDANAGDAELYRQYNKDWDPLDNSISEDCTRRLCEFLDGDGRDSRLNWKGFAGKLNLTCSQIDTIGSRQKSPTNKLLAYFFWRENHKQNTLLQALEKLADIFRQMGNDACFHLVNKEMSECQSKLKSNEDLQFQPDSTVAKTR